VTAKERIGKLEALLSRVRSRASEPRPVMAVQHVQNGGAAATATPLPGDVASVRPAAASVAPVASVPPMASEPPKASVPPAGSVPPMASIPTAQAFTPSVVSMSPPPDDAAWGEPEAVEQQPSIPPSVDDGDVELEVSEVVEVDIDVEEMEALESGAQPVASPTAPPDELEEVYDDDAQPPPETVHDEIAAAAPLANEIEEPAPSSSRRPIAGEEAESAYNEEAPRHTPPPESGKQATAPSVQPAPRMSSVPPPPSLEGHTLIGGWREPGLGQGLPGVGGVRVSGPPAEAPQVVQAPPAPAAPAASGTRLSPEVTRPSLAASGARVATFEGAPAPTPTTMGDLLDLTLGL